MKRIICLTTLLGLLATTVGCQNCSFCSRGARCRTGVTTPAFRLPRLRSPLPPAPGPGCNQPSPGQPMYMQPGYAQPGYAQPGFQQPIYAAPQAMISDQGVPVTDGVIVNQFPTGVIEDGVPANLGVEVRQRPTIPSHIVQESNPGNVVVVPGPESAPLPIN